MRNNGAKTGAKRGMTVPASASGGVGGELLLVQLSQNRMAPHIGGGRYRRWLADQRERCAPLGSAVAPANPVDGIATHVEDGKLAAVGRHHVKRWLGNPYPR